MRNSLIILVALTLFLIGCGKKVVPNLEGFWKIDVAQSSLGDMPVQAKAEVAMRRLYFGNDGTYALSGSDKPDHGTWILNGQEITLKSATGASPPEITVSNDGTQLSSTIAASDLTVTFVFVRDKS